MVATYSLTAEYGDYSQPVTIMFFNYGGAPSMEFGDTLVSIVTPERFGKWGTRAERKAFILAFVRDWESGMALADARGDL
jgi:hypothetical protein